MTFHFSGTSSSENILQASFPGSGTFAAQVESRMWKQGYLELDHIGAGLFDDLALALMSAAVNEYGDTHVVETSFVDGGNDVLSGYDVNVD